MWVILLRPISRGIVMPIRLIMNCELIADRLLLIQVFLPTTRLQEGSTNDSSEVWGGFRMGKRAKVRVLSDTENEIMAEHDGFKGCIHQRKFTINDDVFTINDKIVGNNMTECISYIHFAPDIEVLAISSTEIRTNRANIAVSGANSIEIIKDFVSVEYNRLEPSKTIKIVFCRNLTYQIFQA